MIETLKCFSGRNLTIKNIVAVVLFLFIVANVLYTSVWIAMKRNRQVYRQIIELPSSRTSPSLNATRLTATSTTASTSTTLSTSTKPYPRPIIRRTWSRTSPRYNAAQFARNSTTPLPDHCPYVINMTVRKRNYVLKPVDPPWASLLANYSGAIASGQNLYVWSCNPQRMRKFGNQLFNFAAVFGVAWRNKRIPYWTVRNTHVSYFKHRFVIDKDYQRNVRHFNQ